MWSLGVLLNEIATLKRPNSNSFSIDELDRRIEKAEFITIPKHYSPAIYELQQKMIQSSRSKRATIKEILEVPCVKEQVAKVKRKEYAWKKYLKIDKSTEDGGITKK